MAANEMSFNQVATILNAIQSQVTGQAALTATNTADFVTNATTVLKTGCDPVMNAINQVLSRTIFSVRPYTRKFGGMEISEAQWGNHVRKLTVCDKPIADDDRFTWPVGYDATGHPSNPSGDGESVDQQVINKASVLQTNLYGVNVYQDSYTVYRDQLDVAFRGPEELAQFVSMYVQNITDKLEQYREGIARMTVANFIGGIIDENSSDRVVKLLTEYNAATGLSLTATSVYQPANFRPFMQWAYARIAAITSLMTERSEMFQTQITGKTVNRHTPLSDQRVYLYAPAMYQTEMMALADTYHENYMRLADNEAVNFWQSIRTPDSINLTAGRVDSTGAVVSGAVEQGNIFGVISDREAMGYATINGWSAPAPFNARGGYTTVWIHETERNYNDHTEKGVVLLLE